MGTVPSAKWKFNLLISWNKMKDIKKDWTSVSIYLTIFLFSFSLSVFLFLFSLPPTLQTYVCTNSNALCILINEGAKIINCVSLSCTFASRKLVLIKHYLADTHNKVMAPPYAVQTKTKPKNKANLHECAGALYSFRVDWSHKVYNWVLVDGEISMW